MIARRKCLMETAILVLLATSCLSFLGCGVAPAMTAGPTESSPRSAPDEQSPTPAPKPGDPKATTETNTEKRNSSQGTGTDKVNQQPGPGIVRKGEDWPGFLGPRENGISGETGLLKKWPENGPPSLWTKRIGTGYSAPSVLGNKLILHHRIQDEEIVQCLTADTGEPIWKYAYESLFSDPYGYNNGPRCSPLLTQDRCYTFGAEGKLLCLNLKSGERIWERDTGKDWKVPEAFFGVGSSPVLFNNTLCVMVGGEPDAGVVGFDASTGKTLWTSVGKKVWTVPDDGDYQMDDKLASYSSLIVSKIHGNFHLFALMRDGLVSLNPADGKIRFSYFFRSTSFESVNAARPLIVGDEVLLSAAYKCGAALLKIRENGKGFVELWRNKNLQTHWSTPIYHNGFYYGFSGRHESEATLRCIDRKTGNVVWQTDGLPAEPPAGADTEIEESARFYGRGSAILADGNFVVLGERGLLALVPVNGKEYSEISRFKLPQLRYPCWAAPVLSRGRLYLRSEDFLVCLDLLPPS